MVSIQCFMQKHFSAIKVYSYQKDHNEIGLNSWPYLAHKQPQLPFLGSKKPRLLKFCNQVMG